MGQDSGELGVIFHTHGEIKYLCVQLFPHCSQFGNRHKLCWYIYHRGHFMSNQHKKNMTVTIFELGSYIVLLETFTHSQFHLLGVCFD